MKHPSSLELAMYATRELQPAELLSVDDHLERCLECRAVVAGQLAFGRLELDDGELHLSYEELLSLAEEFADTADLELYRQHIADCPMCAAELKDLQLTIRRPKPVVRSRWWIPATAAIAAGLMLAAFMIRKPAESHISKLDSAPMFSVIRDGKLQLSVDTQGRLLGGAFNESDSQMIVNALRKGDVGIDPATAAWSHGREALLDGKPESAGPSVIGPIGETVEQDRPLLRWKPVRNATAYHVEIYDSNFNEVAGSGELSLHEWQPKRPLARGRVYSWIVSARVRGEEIRFPQPPDAEAKFEVLNSAAATEIARVRTNSSKLLLAITASRYGLWTEAENAIGQIATENPESQSIKTLQKSISSQSKKSFSSR